MRICLGKSFFNRRTRFTRTCLWYNLVIGGIFMKKIFIMMIFVFVLLTGCSSEVKDYNKEAKNLINNGNYTEALNILKEAIEIDDTNDVTWNNLSVCYEAIGEYDLALEAARNAVNYGDEKAVEYSNLGNAYFDLGFLEEARLAYERALDIDSDYFYAKYGLGVYYSKKESYEESQKIFQELLDNNPLNVGVVEHMAYNLYKMKRIDEAMVLLEVHIEKVKAPSLVELLEKIKNEINEGDE